jgi:hypothetical protein
MARLLKSSAPSSGDAGDVLDGHFRGIAYFYGYTKRLLLPFAGEQPEQTAPLLDDLERHFGGRKIAFDRVGVMGRKVRVQPLQATGLSRQAAKPHDSFGFGGLPTTNVAAFSSITARARMLCSLVPDATMRNACTRQRRTTAQSEGRTTPKKRAGAGWCISPLTTSPRRAQNRK